MNRFPTKITKKSYDNKLYLRKLHHQSGSTHWFVGTFGVSSDCEAEHIKGTYEECNTYLEQYNISNTPTPKFKIGQTVTFKPMGAGGISVRIKSRRWDKITGGWIYNCEGKEESFREVQEKDLS